MTRPYESDSGNGFLRSPTLQPGESVLGEFFSLQFMGDDAEDYCQASINKHLWVMGWVEYKDELGYKRRSAFCRQWEGATKCFFIVGSPDYEHQE